MKTFIILLTGLPIIFLSCHTKTQYNDLESEKENVEKAIHSCIGWAKDKDIRLLYSIISNDENYLEVHPDDNIVNGFEEFKKLEKIWMDPAFKAIRYEITDLRIHLSATGNVAWFYCRLDDINEWNGEPANWENTRWTGVLEKREGKWTMVQQHFSFAVE